jgi:hypothetical protein
MQHTPGKIRDGSTGDVANAHRQIILMSNTSCSK